MPRHDDDDLRVGWGPVDGEAARGLEAELARELAPGHALEGRRARAVAQSSADDDVLFLLDDGSVAEVRLTWRSSRETEAEWPWTTVHASRAAWIAAAPRDAEELELGDTLDLHAFAPQDAQQLVVDFVDAWAERGPADVRIIHGKGTGAMQRLVHAVLERHPAVARFALASDRSGWGATVVSIRAPGGPTGS